jgi:hypothetical protein
MDRRTVLRRSAAVPVGVLAAGCSGGDGGNGGDGGDGGTPTDLLGSGAVEIGGISTENPTDEQGTVEYYRAVAGITNTSGDTVPYLEGTMEFRDADGAVLETAIGTLVGFPAEMHWAFDAEYGGNHPGDVASVAVPTVRGFTAPEPADYRETGDVKLGNVERSADEATDRVVVTGDVTNESGSTLDVVQVFANLWVAEDRVLVTVTDRTEGLDDGGTWTFEGSHRFSPHATYLLPIVTEENDPTIPYVTGATRFELPGNG